MCSLIAVTLTSPLPRGGGFISVRKEIAAKKKGK